MALRLTVEPKSAKGILGHENRKSPLRSGNSRQRATVKSTLKL